MVGVTLFRRGSGVNSFGVSNISEGDSQKGSPELDAHWLLGYRSTADPLATIDATAYLVVHGSIPDAINYCIRAAVGGSNRTWSKEAREV